MQLPGTAVLEFVISPVLRAVAKTRADEKHVAILDERRQGEPEFSMWNSLSTASSVNSFAVHTPCNNNKKAFHSLNKETMGPFTLVKLSQMTAGWCIYIWPSRVCQSVAHIPFYIIYCLAHGAAVWKYSRQIVHLEE